MAAEETFKNPYQERRLVAVRAVVAALATFLLLTLLAGRMAYLQIVNHDHFKTLSQENRIKLVAVPRPRGLIYDRNGVVLAENLPTYQLEITPSQVVDLEGTLARLSQIVEISDADRRRFYDELQRKEPFQAIPLLFNLSDEAVGAFAVNRHRFPGVDIVAHARRRYPSEGLAAHAIGYVGRINERELSALDPADYNGISYIGKLGVERRYETLLHGKAGFQHVEINAQGDPLRILDQQLPVPGTDLILSLDMGLQRVAEQALGESNGAVVAIEPTSGEIVALVSRPTYNPNLFVDGISYKAYAGLRDDLCLDRMARAHHRGGRARHLFTVAGRRFKPVVFCLFFCQHRYCIGAVAGGRRAITPGKLRRNIHGDVDGGIRYAHVHVTHMDAPGRANEDEYKLSHLHQCTLLRFVRCNERGRRCPDGSASEVGRISGQAGGARIHRPFSLAARL
jgi:hypothetical protein